jgi:hypothetical protein
LLEIMPVLRTIGMSKRKEIEVKLAFPVTHSEGEHGWGAKTDDAILVVKANNILVLLGIHL